MLTYLSVAQVRYILKEEKNKNQCVQRLLPRLLGISS